MSIKKFFIALLFLSISVVLHAQESAIYRDYQETYKRGMHFYGQRLYGQALEEFDKVVDAKRLFQDTDVPMYILQSELHSGLSALYLGQPDAEKRLLYFMEKNEPSAEATSARLALGNYYYDQRDYNMAIKYLSEVSSSNLSNEEIIEKKFKVGYCYFVKKKFNRANAFFKQIKDTRTQYYYPSNYYYGITEFFDKNYDEALKSFDRASKSSRYGNIVPVYIIQIYFAKKGIQRGDQVW